MNKSARFIRGLFLLAFFCLIPVFTPIGLGGFKSIFTKFSAVENYSMDEKRDILKTFDEKDQNNQGFPINPFDLMNQIKKIGEMNDATTPSDALDEALNAFDESEY